MCPNIEIHLEKIEDTETKSTRSIKFPWNIWNFSLPLRKMSNIPACPTIAPVSIFSLTTIALRLK
jgi:hypothetical protein